MSAPDDRSQVDRRVLLKAALAAPGVAGVLAAQQSSAWAGATAKVSKISLRKADLTSLDPEEHRRAVDPHHRRPKAAKVFGTGERTTASIKVAGITWDGEQSDATFLMRTRSRSSGDWSEWYELHDDGHGPDSASPEAENARRGTDALILETADRIEVRIETDGAIPAEAQVTLIAPSAPTSGSLAEPLEPLASTTELRRPYIYTRSAWGADESIREQTDPEYGEVRGAFVHHTAGSNSYTQADVPGLIEGIYIYHVQSRGWRDIGYNFLIDKFGRIWMGRYGGWNNAVVGAHTENYNSWSFGASVLGNYSTKTAESAVLNAYQKLIAWKFALHDVKPTAQVAYPELKTLPAISGHRDTKATECPGNNLYAKLGTIRNGVVDILANTRVTSVLSATIHTDSVRLRSRIWIDIRWTSLGQGVDGRVALQRLSPSGWEHIRYATITNGRGAVSTLPSADRIYRIRSVHTTDPLNVRDTDSDRMPITAVESDIFFRMRAAGEMSATGELAAEVEWRVGDVGVTGVVEQQYWSSYRWVTSKTVTVTDGIGQAVLKPSRTMVYRMRAIEATTPEGVNIAHPHGSSDEFRVVLS